MNNDFSLIQEINIKKKKSKTKKYSGIVFIIVGFIIFFLFCIGTLRVNVNPIVALGSFALGFLLMAMGGESIYDSKGNLVIYISDCCKKQLQKLYPQYTFVSRPIATEILCECQLFHPKVNHNLDEDDEYAWLLCGKILDKDIMLSQVRCGNMALCNGGWTGPIFFEGIFIKIILATGITSPILAFTSAWGKQFTSSKLLLWPKAPYPLQSSSNQCKHNFTIYSNELKKTTQLDLFEQLLYDIYNVTSQEIAVGIYPQALYIAISWRWTKLPTKKVSVDTFKAYIDLQNSIMECCKKYIQKCSKL